MLAEDVGEEEDELGVRLTDVVSRLDRIERRLALLAVAPPTNGGTECEGAEPPNPDVGGDVKMVGRLRGYPDR